MVSRNNHFLFHLQWWRTVTSCYFILFLLNKNFHVSSSFVFCYLSSSPFSFVSAVDLTAGFGLTEEEKEEKNLSLTPHDILRKLPGIASHNIRSILQKVNSLRELCDCSLEDLSKIMGLPAARKLHTFLHQELDWYASLSSISFVFALHIV